ncbi:hypothetical protein KR054_003972 [Drosophila jambulina]|nr:hypothetical protein KR054_003972 [Drosophila jambulina]
MSQKCPDDKSTGGPPVPPPPRKHRVVPPGVNPADLPSVSVNRPHVAARRSVEPPTTSSRALRGTSPSIIGPEGPSTRKVIGPGSVPSGRGTSESSPVSSRRTSAPDPGAQAGSSGPGAHSQATIRDTEPSTSARGLQSSLRASRPTGTKSDAADTGNQSPRVKIQEGASTTSPADTGDAKAKVPIWKRLFKKSPTETEEPPPSIPSQSQSQYDRRISAASAQSRAKTYRILYTTDEEVRDALIEFTVFIIFLILTSLVTLSVRHSYMFYFNDTMKKLFTSRDMVIAPSVTVNFEKQITVPDWWDYLIYNFLITLHGDLTLTDGKPAENQTQPTHPALTTPAYEPDPSDGDEGDLSEQSPEQEAGSESESESERMRKRRKSGYYWDPGVKRKRRSTEPDRGKPFTHHLEGRVFLYENLLLGPPRLRQVRVKKESCYVNDAFIRYFNSCYAAYSRSAEDRTVFQKIPYKTMSDLSTMPLWTVLAFYRTGGYVVELTYEKKKNLGIITDLKNNHWLDRGSRLCLVEFNLFNDNTDIFQSIKLIAEIPPTGGVIPQAHMQTVKQHSFFTDRSLVMTVIYIFWYIMVVYYTIYEITELRKSGCKNYIFSIVNLLDCIILLLCYLALVYNLWHSYKADTLTSNAVVEMSYQSLDVLCFWNIIYVDMMAILAFLVWIKIFKFISFNKTLVQFTTTLKRCSKDLAGFSLMFGIVFLAYAQLGLLLFGTKHPDFRNFITSILTMIRMILGDFQYNLIEQANRVLGPIYFLTYILLVFFILLNMFLAIIMETYNTVKSEITQGTSHLGSYIYKKALKILYMIIHCGRKRRNNPEPTIEQYEEAKEQPDVIHKNLTATE